jgi:tRNA (guanine26-N2/guanine27-N2)-dimethyltransferase
MIIMIMITFTQPWHIGGPIWAAPMKDDGMLARVIRNVKRAPEGYSPATSTESGSTVGACGIPTKKVRFNYLISFDCMTKYLTNIMLIYIMFKFQKRLMGLLVAHNEELVDVPLYYDLAAIAHTLHCSTPRQQQVRAALTNRGYRVSRSHCKPGALKVRFTFIIYFMIRILVNTSLIQSFNLMIIL